MIDYIGGLALGGVSVFVGTYVAPKAKKETSVVLAALVLIGAGFLLFPSIAMRDYWAIFSIICMGAGAGFVSYGIATGKIEMTQEVA